MRTNSVLRLAGAFAFALTMGAAFTQPATAFAGLSDNQHNEVSKFFKCKTYLFTNLSAFEADPDCGGTAAVDLKSMASGTGSGGYEKPRYECEWDWDWIPEYSQ